MSSPEILKLVEDCPKGAETLITRIIHILTEQSKIENFFHMNFLKHFDFSSTITGFG